jgi:hypothetical protein
MARASFVVAAALALLIGFGWVLTHYAGLQTSLLWTAIIGAIAWAIRSNVEKKREHQRLLAESKRNHYLQFLEFLSRFFSSVAGSSPFDSQSPEFISELRMWSLRLTLIGSDDVVQAWNSARLSSTTDAQGSSPTGVLHSWGKLWLAMRKDSGHLDTKLEISDVLASFVNDIEEHRAEING